MHRLVFAVAFCTLICGGPANAQPTWQETSLRTALAALDSAPLAQTPPAVAASHFVAMPDATPPKYLINFVTAGPAQTGVPCYGCVKGAQTTDNMGFTAAYNYIATNETAQYALTFTNITNTANCKLAWSIAAGAKVLDAFSYELEAPKAGSSYLYGFNRHRPAYSGAAVITAKVTCTGAASQTTTASLYFQ